MKFWNDKTKARGVKPVPQALWIFIGVVVLCVLTARHYEK